MLLSHRLGTHSRFEKREIHEDDFSGGYLLTLGINYSQMHDPSPCIEGGETFLRLSFLEPEIDEACGVDAQGMEQARATKCLLLYRKLAERLGREVFL